MLTRRTFVEGVVVLSGVRAAVFAAPAFSAACRPPVVGFHCDRPYLDLTGLAQPYIPPAGIRSGEALALLSDEVFLARFPY